MIIFFIFIIAFDCLLSIFSQSHCRFRLRLRCWLSRNDEVYSFEKYVFPLNVTVGLANSPCSKPKSVRISDTLLDIRSSRFLAVFCGSGLQSRTNTVIEPITGRRVDVGRLLWFFYDDIISWKHLS